MQIEQDEPHWPLYRAYLIAVKAANVRGQVAAELLEYLEDGSELGEQKIDEIERVLDQADDELQQAETAADFAIVRSQWERDEDVEE